MGRKVTVGVSLKMYFGHRQAREWFACVADSAATHPAVTSGAVELFILPTFLQIAAAVDAFAHTSVRIGAQDVAAAEAGAFTGEVSAAEIAEVGGTLAEVGHAERRLLFGETDQTVAAKTAVALRHGLTPVICVGETDRLDGPDAAAATLAQLNADLDGAPDGAVVVAYEPAWAIGAPRPAPITHIQLVTRALRNAVDTLPGRHGSAVIYGGAAGPGLLTELGEAVDGLFLGRSVHHPDALIAVLDEASAVASGR